MSVTSEELSEFDFLKELNQGRIVELNDKDIPSNVVWLHDTSLIRLLQEIKFAWLFGSYISLLIELERMSRRFQLIQLTTSSKTTFSL